MKAANNAPTYVALYPELAEIARSHGYAMAVHGSVARDFDLICIPWVDNPSPPDAVIDDIVAKFVIRRHPGGWTEKKHGRRAHTICIFGDWAIDLSFMPAKPVVLDTSLEARLADAESDVGRLHKEKMELFEQLHFPRVTNLTERQCAAIDFAIGYLDGKESCAEDLAVLKSINTGNPRTPKEITESE